VALHRTMRKLQGIAVSPGVAIGEALVLGSEGFRVPRRLVSRDAVDDELERFHRARQAADEETVHRRDAVARELGPQYAAIFAAQRQMLGDPRLLEEVEQLVRQRHQAPEFAASRVLRRYARVFESLESSHLAQRAHDIQDVERRLLRHLLGEDRQEMGHLTSPVLVLAHNLTPSETAALDRRHVRGFATEIGGPGSHTAIVAQGMEIPAVVGTGPFLADVAGGELVIVDGNEGAVVVQPDEATLQRYRATLEQDRHQAAELICLRDLPAVTTDGARIELLGNIEFPQEVEQCQSRGCEGIGLYRTEFLYLGAVQEPDEEAHYRAYRRVVEALPGRPIVIRTLDLGADKMQHLPSPEQERNPCLGLRSIRLSLRHVDQFRTQLRAILRASALGQVRVMFPLISTLRELRQAKTVLADVCEDLHERGVPFDRSLKVGMMVEVPAAALLVDRFVDEVDFLSIGTNDLIQYTLAVDRGNMDVAGLYNACDPAILRLIQLAIEAGARRGIPVGLCGQMSSNPAYTMLLVGLGLRQLSVTPSAIPAVKRVCRHVSLADCRAVAERALAMENAHNIRHYLKQELALRLPERA
jgi:phosphotransferase system enzyme I (PtsI)